MTRVEDLADELEDPIQKIIKDAENRVKHRTTKTITDYVMAHLPVGVPGVLEKYVRAGIQQAVRKHLRRTENGLRVNIAIGREWPRLKKSTLTEYEDYIDGLRSNVKRDEAKIRTHNGYLKQYQKISAQLGLPPSATIEQIVSQSA